MRIEMFEINLKNITRKIYDLLSIIRKMWEHFQSELKKINLAVF